MPLPSFAGLCLLSAATALTADVCATCVLPAAGSSVQFALAGNNSGMYLRHAGFLGWATPLQTPLDALDATFVTRAALSSPSPSHLSFENADEFPGYFLRVDEAQTPPRLILAQRPAAPVPAAWDSSASFLLAAALPGGCGCSLSPLAFPSLLLSLSAPAPPSAPSPCHYPTCPPVLALAPPPAPVPPAFAAASSWTLAPPYVPPPPGVTPLVLGGLAVEVHNSTGTLGRVGAAGDASFSFTPLDAPASAGLLYEHMGDVTLRARASNATGAWTEFASSAAAAPPPGGLPRVPPTLPGSVWATDVSPQLGASPVLASLRVVRELGPAPDARGMILSLLVSNVGSAGVDVGGLDVSLPINNNWSGLTLDENAARCSLSDPYVGMDGGYIRVVRITGQGAALLITPYAPPACSNSSRGGLNASGALVACSGSFEAYRMLDTDPTPRGVAFEGYYSWVFLSAAWADTAWRGATPYNAPRYLTLLPGQLAVFSLRLFLSTPSPAASPVLRIDADLAAAGLPVALALPGTVLTPDMASAQLLLRPPPGYALADVSVEPPGAVAFALPPGPANAAGFVPIPMAYGAVPGVASGPPPPAHPAHPRHSAPCAPAAAPAPPHAHCAPAAAAPPPRPPALLCPLCLGQPLPALHRRGCLWAQRQLPALGCKHQQSRAARGACMGGGAV